MPCVVTLSGHSADALQRRAEDFDMTAEDYLTMILNMADTLPRSLLFALSAGVPVRFYASAFVDMDGADDGE